MSAKTLVILLALIAAPCAVMAQRSPFLLSPEYAGDLGKFAGHLHWSTQIRTYTARLDVRSARPVSPWVATGLIVHPGCSPENCLDNGWLVVAGLRADAARVNPIRPYLVGGAGVAVYNRETIDFLPSLGAGVRWSSRGEIVPRLEYRWERYNGHDYGMLAVGVGLALGRPVNAYR